MVMQKIRKYIILFLVVLFSSSLTFSAEKKEPLELLNADSSEVFLEENNIVVNLSGNVSFKHGETNLSSQQAVWYKTLGQVVFTEKVAISDSVQTLKADRVVYYQNTKKLIADGNVNYYNLKEDLFVLGGKGEYDRENKYLVVTENPELVSDYNQKGDLTRIQGDTMEYYTETQVGIAKGNVRIEKGETKAFCKRAEFYNKEQRILLLGNPVANKKEDEITGEKLEIFLKDNKVDWTQAENSKASHKEYLDSLKTKYNESFISGKKIYFFFEDEKLSQVKVEKNATSLYFSSVKDTLSQGKNEVSGDTINLFFSEEKLKNIHISGGVIGTYYSPTGEKDSLGKAKEDTVKYSCEQGNYLVDNDLMTLEGNSKLEYQELSLNSFKIIYNSEKQVLEAEGDTTQKDSLGNFLGEPVLIDGKEQITGQRMSYDLNTKKGKIKGGESQYEEGVYFGKRIRKKRDRPSGAN